MIRMRADLTSLLTCDSISACKGFAENAQKTRSLNSVRYRYTTMILIFQSRKSHYQT